MKKSYYIHALGGSRGNSSKGTNLGSLSSESPHPDLKIKNYYGSLLAWTMFHSDALAEAQVERVSIELKKLEIDFVITNYPAETHEDGIHLKDWLSRQWYWQDKISKNPKVAGRHIVVK